MGKRIDYEQVRRMRGEGLANPVIALALGCCTSTVERAVRQLGLEKRQLGGPKRVNVPELQRLWVNGIRVADIAVRFNVSVGTVHEWAKRFKLPKRPRVLPDLVVDPTPEEIEQRKRECRERHYASRRAESEEAVRSKIWKWQQGGAA
jgi:hypothetical protein